MYQDCLDAEFILQKTDAPESYPIISREYQIKNWKTEFPGKDLLPIWINCANFIINHIKNSAGQSALDDFFVCIAFALYYPRDDWPLVPRIYVADASHKKILMNRFNKMNFRHNSEEMIEIQRGFKSCGIIGNYEFYQDTFKDPAGYGKISWIYCINHY